MHRYWHDTVHSAVWWLARRTHLGSIDVKSENPILLKESMAYSQCVLKDKVGLHTSLVLQAAKGVGCELRVSQKQGEKMWVAIFLLDFGMIIECTTCSGYHGWILLDVSPPIVCFFSHALDK